METISLFPTELIVKKCDLDLKDLEKVCLEHFQKEKSEHRSNAGGYQGHNFNYQPLNDVLTGVMKNLENPERPFTRMCIGSWVNINPKGSFNVLHDHSAPDGFLSGVFYVRVPENSGNIYFRDPRTFVRCFPDQWYSSKGADETSIVPKENMLVVFPTWLSHRVGVNMSEEDRISISFNISNVEFRED